MMNSKSTSRKSGEFRYATRLLALERGKRQNQPKEMAPLKACRQLLKSEDWESSKFSLMPKNVTKKPADRRVSSGKEVKSKYPKNREKVVIVSKRSSSVRVVKSGSQKCLKGVQRSVSVKKVSYSTSVILSSEEDESDSEDEEEDVDDDDYEDKSRISTRKKDTVIKHTMSKIRTNYCKSKKVDSRSCKKAKAIKLLREKSSGKKKSCTPSRELRPRFPYSPMQEWPTARAHRMASLNALAKVHVLYENEGRTQGEPEDSSLMDMLNDDHTSSEAKQSAKEVKSGNPAKEKEKEKEKSGNKSDSEKRKKSTDVKPKVVKRRRKRKHPCDVEIIDTRICKRMASLNAQAILAASYMQERPKRRERIPKTEIKTPPPSVSDTDVDMKEIIAESANSLQIIDSVKTEPLVNKEPVCSTVVSNSTSDVEVISSQPSSSKEVVKLPPSSSSMFPTKYEGESHVAELPTIEQEVHIASASENGTSLSSTSVSEVGVTKYTKVTKVQINATKAMEIKEEGKAERKFERIEKDDVEITRMYHYQANTASQSYCVRMETTYKPSGRNYSPLGNPRSGIPPPHVMGAVMPTRQSYYNYQNRPGILASQSYPLNRSMQPIIGIEQHVARHYGNSAFAMPPYGHAQHMSYPHNEYGYYQPAGPMIQPVHDQYMIHKPVPCHPQPHQQQQITQPAACTTTAASNRDRYAVSDSCFSRHSEAHPPPSAAKSKHSTPSTKHSESLRLGIAPPTSVNSNQFHSRPTSGQIHPSTSENRLRPPHISNAHLRSVLPKHFREPEKQESYKYPNVGTHRYPHMSEPRPYPMPGYRECPPNVLGTQQHSVPAHHSKAHPSMMHPKSCEIPNQYLPPHHPLPTTSVPTKMELPPVHSTTFVDAGKYNVPKYEPAPYKESSSISENTDTSSSDKSPLWRPPLVVDLDNDNEPKNTKTYIELDVPKACPREKIVVVDVDKEEKEHVRKRDTHIVTRTYSCRSSQPDIIELPTPKREPNTTLTRDLRRKEPQESPDVMFIEVTKKKEPSALIRRARLHGKQRTYRDSENRPLAPYTKKIGSSDIPLHYQKNAYQPQVAIPHLNIPRNLNTRMTHGWTWEGKPSEKLVYITNDDPPILRLCYPAMRHHEGDVIKVRDCVLLKSGARKTDLPFIAKIAALWENPSDGEMTMSLFWYYRPEHTDPGRKPHHTDGEVFASKHCDTNSVACIEDKCFVLTFGEYCRYRRHCKMLESTCESPVSVVPPIDDYHRKERLPPSCISPEMVFFCRKVYDFRQKRILKNPA